MYCLIADLICDVPEAGGLAPRCKEYRYDGKSGADITIRTELYCPSYYHPNISENSLAYMESARQFYLELMEFDGMYLHASAVAVDGKAYLFSGPCGTGKSTHTRLWQQIFGERAKVFNDDKPALRCLDGTWYAYGTPWCGKDGININMKVPLAGICFLKQAPENKIRQLSQPEAIRRIISQTFRKFKAVERMDLMLSHVGELVQKIPVFELENRPEQAAALMSYETMRKAAEELGL